MSRFSLESLESRRLLLTTPPTGAAIIAADEAELNAAQTQANNDLNAGNAVAQTDAADVQSARQSTLRGSAQQNKLNADKISIAALLASDQSAINTAATNALPPVTDDYKQIAADNGNSSALAADQAQLVKDQASLQSAVAAAVAQLQTDQNSTNKTLAADRAAINALLQSTPAYTSAVTKQQSDAAASTATNRTDQAIISVVQSQLKLDQQTYGGANSYSGNTTINSGTLTLNGYRGSDADSVADQAEIASIQAQLNADQATQASDNSTDTATVAAARSAILSALPQLSPSFTTKTIEAGKFGLIAVNNPALSPPAQLASDQATFTAFLQADDKAIRQIVEATLPAVIADFEQIASDQGNSSALTTDQNQLTKDQGALHANVAGGVAKLEADKKASATALANDLAAINTLLQSTPAYVSAENKLQSDASADTAKVQTDQAILSAAQAKLSADQAAWAASTNDDFGAISGSGSISYIGAGTTTLSGANTYSGTTTINSGSLSSSGSLTLTAVGVSSGATTISGIAQDGSAVTVIGSGVFSRSDSGLLFNGGAGSTVSSSISGSDSLTLSGGTTTLTGTNSYTGNTTISQGTVYLSGNSTLNGVSTMTLNAGSTQALAGTNTSAGITLSSGTVSNENSVAILGTGTLSNPGTINLTSASPSINPIITNTVVVLYPATVFGLKGKYLIKIGSSYYYVNGISNPFTLIK